MTRRSVLDEATGQAAPTTFRTTRWIGAAAVVASAASVALAPLLLPAGYSIVAHSISESAAQATTGAWLGRAGLGLLGAAGLLLATPISRGSRWARLGMLCFGVGLIASAVWSHAPWLPHLPSDPAEDMLHSLASSVVGVGIVSATLALTLRSPDRVGRWFSLVTLIVSCLAPALMATDSAHAGLWQRLMFGTAMVWLIAASCIRGEPRAPRTA